MRNMYELVYKTYVVAYDQEEAEQIARDMNLTIQDSSVKANSAKIIFNPKIIKSAEKLIISLFKIPGTNPDFAKEILKDHLSYICNPNEEELEALYAHCECVMLHDYSDDE